MKNTKIPSYHEGASDERSAVIAKLRREMKFWYEKNQIIYWRLHELLEWMLARRKRYEARPGGLGRKKAAKA